MNTQTALFNTVAPQDSLQFWSNHGLDFQKLRDFTGFDAGDIARIAGVPKTSVRFDHRMSVEIKEHMEAIANICNLIFQFFENEAETKLWLETPNPMFGYVAPREMVLAGRYKKLLKFVTDALEDQMAICDWSKK